MRLINVYGAALGTVAAGTMMLCLTTPAVAAGRVGEGKVKYERYCSSCHGTSGKGDGPVASSLTAKPTDLTQIAKTAGGEFPTARVMQSIDGTLLVRAHGSAEMPVWGQRFQHRVTAQGDILLITEYLRSIQEK